MGDNSALMAMADDCDFDQDTKRRKAAAARHNSDGMLSECDLTATNPILAGLNAHRQNLHASHSNNNRSDDDSGGEACEDTAGAVSKVSAEGIHRKKSRIKVADQDVNPL